MSYATMADLVPLRMTLDDLAELTSETDQPDPAVVQAACDEASAVVDSYCSTRYTVPLQPSALVKRITLDLVIYDLYSRRKESAPSETCTQRRDTAMTYLRDVTAGRAALDQPATAEQGQTASSDVTTPCRRQIFDDDHLRGFC